MYDLVVGCHARVLQGVVLYLYLIGCFYACCTRYRCRLLIRLTLKKIETIGFILFLYVHILVMFAKSSNFFVIYTALIVVYHWAM